MLSLYVSDDYGSAIANNRNWPVQKLYSPKPADLQVKPGKNRLLAPPGSVCHVTSEMARQTKI